MTEAAPAPRRDTGSQPFGIMAPIPTPFDDEGEIDRTALAQLIDFYLRAKVHSLFALGSAGQGPAMRADQRRTAAELIMDRVGGAVPVVLQVGTADIQTTLQIARHGAALRPAALAVSPPYYYGDHTPFEIAAHFAAVVEAVDTPVFIYDNPRYAGIAMSPGATARLAKALPALRGIILEQGGLESVLQFIRSLPPEFKIFSGAVECLLPAQPYGLAGVTCGASSIFPELAVALWESTTDSEYHDAFFRQHQLNELSAILDRYAITTGRTVYRDVLRLRGLQIKRYPRWPSADLEDEVRTKLSEELDALGAFALPRARAAEPMPEGAPAESPADDTLEAQPGGGAAEFEPAIMLGGAETTPSAADPA